MFVEITKLAASKRLAKIARPVEFMKLIRLVQSVDKRLKAEVLIEFEFGFFLNIWTLHLHLDESKVISLK